LKIVLIFISIFYLAWTGIMEYILSTSLKHHQAQYPKNIGANDEQSTAVQFQPPLFNPINSLLSVFRKRGNFPTNGFNYHATKHMLYFLAF
jgi:hypothetical protein